MKTCTKCRIEKPRSEFGKHSSSKDGLQPRCRACRSIDNKNYCKANPEKRKESANGYYYRNLEKYRVYRDENSEKIVDRVNEWAKNNPTKVKANKKRWADANKSKLSEKAVRYRLQNPEKMREFQRVWQANNRDKVRLYTRNRRALRNSAEGVLSKDIAERLFAEQEGKCVYCQADLSIVKVHLDHRMPLKLGGSNSDDNAQLLCQRCNCRKGAKHPDDFERQIGYIK